MKIDVVADVGNTSIKVARCKGEGFWPTCRMSHDQEQWSKLSFFDRERRNFAIAGVVPSVVVSLTEWSKAHGLEPFVIDHFSLVPIAISVLNPGSVGIDRLLDALAATHRFPNRKLIVIDCGTAITINAVEGGAFDGGAILPGLGLMAKSLNDDTALLPKVQIEGAIVFPGKDTQSNINTGILASVLGAIERCAREYCPNILVFTGTDGPLLHQLVQFPSKELVPTLTLEGIRIAAEALP